MDISCLAVLLLAPLAPAADATNENSLLLLPLQVQAVDARTATLVSDALLIAAQQSGDFGRVISTHEVENLVSVEQQRQLLACDGSGCLAEAAGALGARWVINGSVGRLGKSVTLSLSLLDLKSTRVVSSVVARGCAADESQLLDFVPMAFAQLIVDAGIRPRPPGFAPRLLRECAPPRPVEAPVPQPVVVVPPPIATPPVAPPPPSPPPKADPEEAFRARALVARRDENGELYVTRENERLGPAERRRLGFDELEAHREEAASHVRARRTIEGLFLPLLGCPCVPLAGGLGATLILSGVAVMFYGPNGLFLLLYLAMFGALPFLACLGCSALVGVVGAGGTLLWIYDLLYRTADKDTPVRKFVTARNRDLAQEMGVDEQDMPERYFPSPD